MVLFLLSIHLTISLSLSLSGLASRRLTFHYINMYVYDTCHICLLRSPPSERWQLSSSPHQPTFLVFPDRVRDRRRLAETGTKAKAIKALKTVVLMEGFHFNLSILGINWGECCPFMGIHSWQNIPLQFVNGLDSALILCLPLEF